MRRFTLKTLLGLVTVTSGCASGVISYRNVDTPAGSMQQYGAPKNIAFEVASEISNDRLRLTIFQHSECDVLKINTISRVRETLRDGDVVHQDPATLIQRAEGPTGAVIPCDQTYARDVAVSLEWGNSTYPLGQTTPLGEIEVSLSKDLKNYLYSDDSGENRDATVIINWQDRGQIGRVAAGTISGAKLNERERRINALLDEMNQLLSSGDISEPKDILRSYQLYEELRQLDTTGDPRIAAAAARFAELFFERKRLEARVDRKLDAADQLELAALKNAKEILEAGLVSLPPFIATAVSQGALSEAVQDWLLGQTIVQARTVPGLCQGPFSWENLDRGKWDSLTRFTLSYDRYAYGDSFPAELPHLCSRAHGW